ncbi:MAG: permease-like cell division protein FtsX [Erysipelotrichaceae bacterium]
MFRNIGNHFKEAFYGITRHFAMALSSMTAVAIALFLVGIFMIASSTIDSFSTNIQQSIQVHVKLRDDVGDVGFKQIKEQISKIENVNEVTFSSKDIELDKFIDSYGEAFEMYRGPENPLKNAFIVNIKENSDINTISNTISQISGVYEVNFGGLNTVALMETLRKVRDGGYIFVAILSILAIFLISNTIKVTISNRENEIGIMRYIGATNGYVRSPFLIEGAVIGLIGSIPPTLIIGFGYNYIYDLMHGHLFTELLTMMPAMPYIYYLSAILLGVGILVGFIGSFISVSKHLRLKR